MLVVVVAVAAVAVVAVVVAAQLLYSLAVEAEVGDVGLVVIRPQQRHSRRQSPSLKSARNPNPNSAHHLMRSPYQCRHRDRNQLCSAPFQLRQMREVALTKNPPPQMAATQLLRVMGLVHSRVMAMAEILLVRVMGLKCSLTTESSATLLLQVMGLEHSRAMAAVTILHL